MVALRELMSREVRTTSRDTPVAKAAGDMVSRRIGSVVVTTGSVVVGILTERDVLRAAAAGLDLTHQRVGDWMTEDPVSADPDTEAADATETMLAGGFRHLPVVDGADLAGIVSLRDLLSSWIHHA